MFDKDNTKLFESKNKIIPGIYITSTPLGNRYDITLRALYILNQSNIMLCEDTRKTKNLFKLLNIEIKDKRWVSYNDHNSKENFPLILKEYKNKKIICLVSDAGTPLISDPGYKLIKFAKKNNIKLITIPGPCSVISALSISGLKTNEFFFVGFLPKKKGDYVKKLREYKTLNSTLVLYERANRINILLDCLNKEFNNFDIALAKELTKINEEVIPINSSYIGEYLNKNIRHKGEFTVIIEFNETLKKKRFSDKMLLKELMTLKPSQVSSMLSKKSFESRENIYKRCIMLKKSNDKNS